MIKKIKHEIEIDFIEFPYGDEYFLSMSAVGQKGVIYSLPFYTETTDKDGDKIPKLEGYLVFSDPEVYNNSSDWLNKTGLDFIVQNCRAGCSGKLYPLPYKIINSHESARLVLEDIIKTNTITELSKKLIL